jgi:hypothetical protein
MEGVVKETTGWPAGKEGWVGGINKSVPFFPSFSQIQISQAPLSFPFTHSGFHALESVPHTPDHGHGTEDFLVPIESGKGPMNRGIFSNGP